MAKTDPHPRHHWKSRELITEFACETLAGYYRINPEMADRYIKHTVVVSCLNPYYDFDWLFGDWIDFDKLGQGLYQHDQEFSNLFLALQGLLDNKKQVFLIFPQPYPVDPRWEKNSFFNYIELPEFYGTYATWFETYYPKVDVAPAFDKHFMFLNKRNRIGRQALFCQMIEEEVLDNGYVSFLGHGMSIQTKFSDEIWNINQELMTSRSGISKEVNARAREMMPYQPHELTRIVDDFCGTGGWLPDADLYRKSFVAVVGETHETLNGQAMFTEKTFRAMWFERPFLLLSSSGSLIQLKKLGFQTFDRWFDESYDLEKSLFARAAMISAEIKRITTLDFRQCEKIWQEMKPVLEHNKNHLKKMRTDLDERLKVIDQFIDDRAQSIARRYANIPS